MTTQLELREDSVASIRLVRRTYSAVSQLPNSRGFGGQPPFPLFDELLDEFIIQVIEDETTLTNKQIDEELARLNERDELTVENGFRETELGFNVRMELLNTLLALQVTFIMDGKIHNSPVQEVW